MVDKLLERKNITAEAVKKTGGWTSLVFFPAVWRLVHMLCSPAQLVCFLVVLYNLLSWPILDTLQKKSLLVSGYSHWYQKSKGLKYPSKIDLVIN